MERKSNDRNSSAFFPPYTALISENYGGMDGRAAYVLCRQVRLETLFYAENSKTEKRDADVRAIAGQFSLRMVAVPWLFRSGRRPGK